MIPNTPSLEFLTPSVTLNTMIKPQSFSETSTDIDCSLEDSLGAIKTALDFIENNTDGEGQRCIHEHFSLSMEDAIMLAKAMHIEEHYNTKSEQELGFILTSRTKLSACIPSIGDIPFSSGIGSKFQQMITEKGLIDVNCNSVSPKDKILLDNYLTNPLVTLNYIN